MTDVFVTNQVELARADLADRDYESAARRAEEALKLQPGSAEAREVLDQAGQAKRQIDDSVTQARDAFGRGDVAAASEALGRVMALAPRHPVVAELSAALKEHLRPQAEDSRRQAEARPPGRDGGSGPLLGGLEAGHAARDGGGCPPPAAGLRERRAEVPRVAQRLRTGEAGGGRGTRRGGPAPSIREAAASSRAPPPGPPRRFPRRPLRRPARPSRLPTAAAAPTAPPTAAPLPSPSASLPPAPGSPADGADAAVRRVIAEYGRAIGSQDLALFRSLKPDLSADEEKRLREAFKMIKSQVVGITVESVAIDGDRATVRVTRQDVVNGRPMKPAAQTFRLARSAAGWQIQSIGQ